MNTATNQIGGEVEISLTLFCQLTKPGETVKVTGNMSELGNWNPVKAVPLKTGPTEFPKWKGTLKIKSDNLSGKLEYKYLILREIDNHVIQWEPFDGNRIVELSKLSKAIVEDIYGQHQHLRCDMIL